MASTDTLGAEPLATSHWTSSAPAATPTERLDRIVKADVAVIGAGYTGLVAGLRCAEAGRRVVIVDAAEPGWGASGRNTGQVVPLMWGMHKTPRHIAAQFGAERGDRLNRRVAAAAGDLFSLIARYSISCDVRRGYLCVARSPKSLGKWRSAFAEWERYRGRFELIEREALSAFVTSPRYAGGILLPEGGHLNPLALSRGLAQAARSCGAQIFAESRVSAVTRGTGGWCVKSRSGEVHATSVLLGAGAYTDGLVPSLSSVGSVAYCGVLATDPLDDRGASFLPGGLPVADLDDPAVFGPVVDAQGCLVVSFLVGRQPPDIESATGIVNRRMARAFPGRRLPLFRRLWAGRFLLTPDGVPRIIRIADGFYAAAGCNGLGHTLGFAAAQQLADLALGQAEADADWPVLSTTQAATPRWIGPLLRSIVFPLANRLGA